jgi:hypothetical protein
LSHIPIVVEFFACGWIDLVMWRLMGFWLMWCSWFVSRMNMRRRLEKDRNIGLFTFFSRSICLLVGRLSLQCLWDEGCIRFQGGEGCHQR